MIPLRVVVDGIIERHPRGIARYSEELTRALRAQAPPDCEVVGVVSAVSPTEESELTARLPGLGRLQRLPLGRRELRAAWQYGLTARPFDGMVHAPSLFAPMTRHDRAASGRQVVVTVHESPSARTPDQDPASTWTRQMLKRAHRYADAVVVPTHAVAHALAEDFDFGGRIRVIAGAVSSTLVLPHSPDETVARLGLPDSYVLAVGSLDPRKNLEALLRAAAHPAFPDIPVLVVGPAMWRDRDISQAVFESGAATGRIRHLEPVSDADLAVIIDRATLMVVPSRSEGFSFAALEALHFGTPLVHSDDPSLMEVVAGAGVVVASTPSRGFDERLAGAVASTAGDSVLLARLAVEGQDRARSFSWADTAERIWQLHAEL